MNNNIIEMSEITKVYSNGLLETVVLRDFSIQVRRGEFLAIMGPSGSGKTTFLNLAGLLDTFTQGRYTLDGIDVTGLSDRAMSRLRNRKLSFIFQSFNLLPDLNVFDNIDVPLRYRGLGWRERKKRIESALDRVGLGSRIGHLPSQLSGGQQQRAAIARAIAGDPEIILADEPTGNLDSVMARRIIDLLEELNSAGSTVIMVTHDHQIAARAARKIHILDGQVIDTRPSRSRLASVPEADSTHSPEDASGG